MIIDSVIKYDDDDNSAIDEHYLIENDRDEEEAPQKFTNKFRRRKRHGMSGRAM